MICQTLPTEKRMADGTVDRSKIYIATKVNPMGIGAENEARGVAPHGYDSEIVTWQGVGVRNFKKNRLRQHFALLISLSSSPT